MDSHQLDIVALAWSRELGLPDDALRVAGSRTIRPATDTVRFLRFAGASALVGPPWFLDRAAALDDDALASRSTLGDLTRDHGGRCTGPRLLAYASEVGDINVASPLISHVLPHVLALQALCPPDDVAEADLTARRNWFTLLDEDARPLSCAGYSEWQGIIARLGVLTVPEARRRGNGTTVGRLCTNDAMDEGMIPEWRSHPEDLASRGLAARLGYEELGSVTEVALP
ncbi:GNAT family N-acetyltransferase [Rhodococcus sp. NPDC058505]|uniref:GNAT family N-acetyltransferase n=1 Tax=Rhodococcus sp. NPDC058505 TaxID=3346531 RepID=UPI0036514A40